MFMPWRYFRRLLISAVFGICFVGLTLFSFRVLSQTETSRKGDKSHYIRSTQNYKLWSIYNTSISKEDMKHNVQDLKQFLKIKSLLRERRETPTSTSSLENISTNKQNVELNYNEEEEIISCTSKIHVFYYPWYGNPVSDGKYIHWNHEYLPHWDTNIAKQYNTGRHQPPKDIGSNFYPKLGCYSSRDPEVIDNHMMQIKDAGVGVVVVSWYPPGAADQQGIPVDNIISQLLNAADNHGLKVTLHVEPYKGRNARTVQKDVKYIIDKYFKHPAFYKYNKGGHLLPLLYIYDSYHTKPEDWAQLMTVKGSHSMRNTKYDAVMIGLLVKSLHKRDLKQSGFDGFYTYFASHGFTYGSNLENWAHLSLFATQANMLFIPSVGPGYIDTRVRPWNNENTKHREKGQYYSKSLKFALDSNPNIVSITSFNEWHEGTQIEAAVPKRIPGFIYADYLPAEPDYYLKLTKKFVEKFKCTD